ncbi:MAG: T9SS type A sorting domain-containing protein, partial [Bacteroidales bacterium]|nr:T9SS type A sorting domain-containing protein [Bacteroidales bacterium]
TTTYNPSSGDLAKDSIALKLSAWAVTPCEAPDSDTLILSINKNPTIGFEENIYPCTSAPIDLDTIIEVKDYDEISWSSSGDGSFTGSYPEKYYNPGEEDINNEQMTISLTAAPQSGCSESVSDSTLIYLTPGPSIENLEDIREAAFNETITFEPTVTGANPLAYKWMPDSLFDDSSVKNGTIKPIMYNGNGLPDTNLVRFKVTDLANECAAVDTVEVQMELKQPVIEFANDTTNVCKGSPLELNSLIENIARGSGPEHFDTTWSSPGPTVHPTQDTEYQLTVEDSFADNASKSIDIHVLDSADKPQIKEEESTKNVSEYSRATYEPVNTDTEDAYYEWSALNGSVVQGQGTSEATIEWGMAGQGEVYLKKTTPFGCFGVHDTLKVDIGVDAVQEITTVENLKIYPNPVKDELNITFHLKESKEVEFVLFNSMGGALQQREAPDKMPGQQEFRLDMSRYNSGMYLLKLRVGEESVLKRIIRIK